MPKITPLFHFPEAAGYLQGTALLASQGQGRAEVGQA